MSACEPSFPLKPAPADAPTQLAAGADLNFDLTGAYALVLGDRETYGRGRSYEGREIVAEAKFVAAVPGGWMALCKSMSVSWSSAHPSHRIVCAGTLADWRLFASEEDLAAAYKCLHMVSYREDSTEKHQCGQPITHTYQDKERRRYCCTRCAERFTALLARPIDWSLTKTFGAGGMTPISASAVVKEQIIADLAADISNRARD